MTEAAGPGFLDLLRVMAALAVVLGLVVLAGWFLRRRPMAGRGRQLVLEDRLTLAKGVQVVVVATGGRKLLLGVTDRSVRLVTELQPAEELAPEEMPEPKAVASPPVKFPPFANWLAERLAHGRKSA